MDTTAAQMHAAACLASKVIMNPIVAGITYLPATDDTSEFEQSGRDQMAKGDVVPAMSSPKDYCR
eukprot:4886726-Amphidinium_carterae.1